MLQIPQSHLVGAEVHVHNLLLPTAVCDVDLVEQLPVHLPQQNAGRLHSDHHAFLREVQPQRGRTDYSVPAGAESGGESPG